MTIKRRTYTFLAALMIFFSSLNQGGTGCAEDKNEINTYGALISLHEIKRPPKKYDWMDMHHEPGQTFRQFVGEYPDKLPKDLTTIYITLVGEFDARQKEGLDQTIEYIEAFFGYPVKVKDRIALSEIPEKARRTNPFTRQEQVLTRYVIEDILIPRKQKDAIASIALSSADVWPGAGWNFVFGEASPDDRVGIWSLYRNGDPSKGEDDYQLFLRRTIKTAVHEIGHMFGLGHCVYYECLMNGSNHRKESDSQPLWLCPIDLKKVTWLFDSDLNDRFKRMIKITDKLGLEDEKSFYIQSQEKIR